MARIPSDRMQKAFMRSTNKPNGNAKGSGTRKYNKVKKNMTWAEEQDAGKYAKQMTSKKTLLRQLNKDSTKRFGSAKQVAWVYAAGSKYGPGQIEGVWSVKMEDGMKGWIDKTTLKFWSVDDTVDILSSLDQMAVQNDIKGYEDLLWRYQNDLTPAQQAKLSKRLSEIDWDQTFRELYAKDKPEAKSRKKSKYEEIQQMITEIQNGR